MTIEEVNNKIADLRQQRRDRKNYVSPEQFKAWGKQLRRLYWYRKQLLS